MLHSNILRAIAFYFFVLAIFGGVFGADIKLETDNLRLEMNEAGILKNLVDKTTGKDYSYSSEPGAVFRMRIGWDQRQFAANGVRRSGDKLFVDFAEQKVKLSFDIIEKSDYLALKVASVEGGPISGIDICLQVKKLKYLGEWIDVAYDDDFGICLCAGNIKTDAKMRIKANHIVMSTMAQKDVALEGTISVLFGCKKPKDTFLDVMQIVEEDLDLPRGAKARKSPVQEYSYFWTNWITTKNVDGLIKEAKRAGFRMMLFSYKSFAESCGHYYWRESYPNGMADLKEITDKIRAAGMKVGMHMHYNKAHTHDKYVTPVPDDRLHKMRKFTLAKSMNTKSDTIIVNENPKGCVGGKNNQRRGWGRHNKGKRHGMAILQVGSELIQYTTYTTEPPYTFTGCKRGHLGTKVNSHRSGNKLELLDVDNWPIFVRFDQNTDIQDETAARLAKIIKETGPYDMLYFDGAEDIHPPRWYHRANAEWWVLKQAVPAPMVVEAAGNTHFTWHMNSRSNAYDSVSPDKMKDFCRKHPCVKAASNELNFTRVNFGWLQGFGRSLNSYFGPDVLEFILSRGAAWDCPFSMAIDQGQINMNPLTDDCFAVIKIWEDARILNKLSDKQREELKNLEQEHHLFINKKGEYELVEIEDVDSVAGSEYIKAYSFDRKSEPGNTYVLIWTDYDSDLIMPVEADVVTLSRPFGVKDAVKSDNGKAVVSVGSRRYLKFAGMNADEVVKLLSEAKFSAAEPVTLYFSAEKFSKKIGKMELISSLGQKEDGSIGDCIVPTKNAASDVSDYKTYVEYTFDCPYAGRWYLWGRVKYNSGSNSFMASMDKEGKMKQMFGNTASRSKWLWEGGSGVKVKEAGEVTVRFYLREAKANISPLLDVVCLTNNPDFKPDDESAKRSTLEIDKVKRSRRD
jgi:hypothetical protein